VSAVLEVAIWLVALWIVGGSFVILGVAAWTISKGVTQDYLMPWIRGDVRKR
jgi:hypothetical protein